MENAARKIQKVVKDHDRTGWRRDICPSEKETRKEAAKLCEQSKKTGGDIVVVVWQRKEEEKEKQGKEGQGKCQ